MKSFLVALAMTIILMSSQASTIENQTIPTLIGASARTVTKKDRVLVNIHTVKIPKPKLFRSNALRKYQILGGTDPSQAVDDEDYIFARNRNRIEVKKNFDENEELSDYVTVRLAVARAKAMEVYRNKWQT